MRTHSPLKLLIIGDPRSGKTAFVNRFFDDKFSGDYKTTIGANFKTSELLDIQLWDIAGDERYQTIVDSYYRGTHGIILTCDPTDGLAYDHLNRHLDSIRQKSPNTPIMLVATKSDLHQTDIIHSISKLKTFANEHDLLFAVTSAKTGEGVVEAVELITQKIRPDIKPSADINPQTIPPKKNYDYRNAKIELINIFETYEKKREQFEFSNIANTHYQENEANKKLYANFISAVKTLADVKNLLDPLSEVFDIISVNQMTQTLIKLSNFLDQDNKLMPINPTSLDLYQALKKVDETLSQFKPTANDAQTQKIVNLKAKFYAFKPILLNVIKKELAQELKDELTNPDHKNPEDAVKAFAKRFDNPTTEEILNLNRQSKTEIALKIASIIAILAGVGIITTGYLIYKRHQASSGQSWNFFNPLSADVKDATSKELGKVGISLPTKKK